MPNLLQKVNTYHGWASSALDDIYEKARLESALKLEATALESIVMINDGEGRFTIQSLPVLAQIAPIYGIALSDFDGDGLTDAVLAQNFFTTQQETGPYDGGLGLLLRGVGDSEKAGGLREVWPRESGVIVPGDAKSLGLVDFDGGGRPDLFFGMNHAAPVILMNEAGEEGGSPLMISLEGKPGNLSAIGARVSVEVEGLPLQTAEVSAGSGYLTQGTPDLFFGWGAGAMEDTTAEVTVRWPDGSVSESRLTRGDGPRHVLTAK
jgi:hypothetical protein